MYIYVCMSLYLSLSLSLSLTHSLSLSLAYTHTHKHTHTHTHTHTHRRMFAVNSRHLVLARKKNTKKFLQNIRNSLRHATNVRFSNFRG